MPGQQVLGPEQAASPVQQDEAQPYDMGLLGPDPSMYGNQFLLDQMQPSISSGPAASEPAGSVEPGRVLGAATALPKANNLARLGKAVNTVSASRAAGGVGPAATAMQEATGAGFLQAGSKLGTAAKGAGVVGGLATAGSAALDIADGKDENGEKYLQVGEGLLGAGGAASGNAVAASASTGLMLGRSSNDYYEKHTGKSVSEWVGDAGASVNRATSSGIKDTIEGTVLDGSYSRGVADRAGWIAGGATVLGGSVLGAAASVGGGMVGLVDSLFGD